ncbi:hypothetical protein AAMO2058_000793200 [Amorphochlora amoebiformis]
MLTWRRVLGLALPFRGFSSRPTAWEMHDKAVKEGMNFYTDPETGLMVFTRVAHERRGRCCGSGCRHCAFQYEGVRKRASSSVGPMFLHRRLRNRLGSPTGRDVLFWSSGKDSFLTLRRWIKENQEKPEQIEEALDSVTLLTTFDFNSHVVAHQETDIADVVRQAAHLDLDLVGVPLHPGTTYQTSVSKGLKLIEASSGPTDSDSSGQVKNLIFGDLHLEHIKEYRDKELKSLTSTSYKLCYPLYGAKYSELLRDLKESQVPCVISAHSRDSDFGVPQLPPQVRVGGLFGEEMVKACSLAGIDTFGENGEFHTLAQVWKVSRDQALGIPAANNLNATPQLQNDSHSHVRI